MTPRLCGRRSRDPLALASRGLRPQLLGDLQEERQDTHNWQSSGADHHHSCTSGTAGATGMLDAARPLCEGSGCCCWGTCRGRGRTVTPDRAQTSVPPPALMLHRPHLIPCMGAASCIAQPAGPGPTAGDLKRQAGYVLEMGRPEASEGLSGCWPLRCTARRTSPPKEGDLKWPSGCMTGSGTPRNTIWFLPDCCCALCCTARRAQRHRLPQATGCAADLGMARPGASTGHSCDCRLPRRTARSQSRRSQSNRPHC